MSKLALVKGTTSYRAYLFILDSSVTTGAGKTGLAYNTAGLVAYYVRPGAAATAITLATQTATGAYSSGGFVEVDATNMPGIYRLDVPDAALATGVNAVVIMLKGAANMAPVVMEIELTGTDNQNATTAGLANLDAAISSRSTYAGGAVASVTGNVGGNVTGSVGSVATGGIAAASFAAGAIDNAAIATDAIGSAELAASAVTEIQSGLATSSALMTAQADLDDIQTRLPAALISGRIDATVGAMQANVMTAAAAAADLTTELQTGLSTLDAAGVRSAVGLASANLDTQMGAIDDFLDTEVAAIKAKTDNLPAAPAAVGDIPTANQTTDALLDRANAVETGLTLRQAMRLIAAALAGKVSGAATTTVTIRNAVADSKDRLVATVDADGNRSAITTDLT